jgi:hypothetical protein
VVVPWRKLCKAVASSSPASLFSFFLQSFCVDGGVLDGRWNVCVVEEPCVCCLQFLSFFEIYSTLVNGSDWMTQALGKSMLSTVFKLRASELSQLKRLRYWTGYELLFFVDNFLLKGIG